MRRRVVASVMLLSLALAACDDSATGDDAAQGEEGGDEPTLVIGGIPDQDMTFLEERFGAVADYLSDEVGIPVEYQPSSDYTALVTAFRNGDVKLSWFGGFTGVQARNEVSGTEAIVQRDIDDEFEVVFIAHRDVGAESLADLADEEDLDFTFGSESSTSGHLMPRHFLNEAGIEPEADFATVSYSGSHDTTAELVEAGSFDAGGLNPAVWDRLVEEGEVDLDVVEVVDRPGPYYNYHWGAHPEIDEVHGEGTTDAMTEAFLTMHESEEGREIIEMFEAERFIETENANYDAIEQVGRDLEMIE